MDDYREKRFEEFRIGDAATFTKTFTEDDVRRYAELTGDRHPAHAEGEYAARSRFGRPVVHGMLTAGLLSTAHGLLLKTPGAISVEQNLRFLRPVFIGDTITATTEVVKIIPEQRWLHCRTTCTNQRGEKVIVGDAIEMKDDAAE